MENTDSFNYKHGQLYEPKIAQLHPNPNQIRKIFDQESIEDLKKSILEIGLINPISFSLVGGQLVTVAGEHRRRAFLEIGYETIPGIYVDQHLEEIALAENLQRNDLNLIDKADAIRLYKKLHNYTLKETVIKLKLSSSVPSLSEFLSLCRLPEDVKTECRKNRNIPVSKLVEIAKADDERAMRRLFKTYLKKLDGKNNKKTIRRGTGISGLTSRIYSMSTQIQKADIDSTNENEYCKLLLAIDWLEQVMRNKVINCKSFSVSKFRKNGSMP
ncbi:MAG: hypothetical protein A2X82_15390 [Geobacteraceae bacterium GWC2_55_20]|nr:MAG: hypothetical protein A2X82_15390 [Geobacteraceae bacterium GWC2_55_20]OGU25644.1 MAG: hypothetical protein A2X85_11210 [Geobacteraceae bacterium GWF2_54_21]